MSLRSLLRASLKRRALTSASNSSTFVMMAPPDRLWSTISSVLNQSQGGMCICRVLGIGAGVSRECFGP